MIDYNDLLIMQERKEAEALKKLPLCVECGTHIEDEFCYNLGGWAVCEYCMEQNHRTFTSDMN